MPRGDATLLQLGVGNIVGSSCFNWVSEILWAAQARRDAESDDVLKFAEHYRLLKQKRRGYGLDMIMIYLY